MKHYPESGFALYKSFNIVVPKDYDGNTQISSFVQRQRKGGVIDINTKINDKNLAGVTHRLVPGSRHEGDIIHITSDKGMSFRDCLEHISRYEALLVGAQGISLVWELIPGIFPISRYVASLDKESALYKNTERNIPMIPAIGIFTNPVPPSARSDHDRPVVKEGWRFNLISSKDIWRPATALRRVDEDVYLLLLYK